MKNSCVTQTDCQMKSPSGRTFRWSGRFVWTVFMGSIGNSTFVIIKLDNAKHYHPHWSSCNPLDWEKDKWIHEPTLGTDGQDYVIASDTDSIYLNLGTLLARVGSLPSQRVVDVLNKFCQNKIVPFINKSYDELSDYLCVMKRPLWWNVNVLLNVVSGLPRNVTSWMCGITKVFVMWNPNWRWWELRPEVIHTAPCRQYIKECLNIVMGGTEKELIDYIENTRGRSGVVFHLWRLGSHVQQTTSVSSVTEPPFMVNPHPFTSVVLFCSITSSKRKRCHTQVQPNRRWWKDQVRYT